MLPLWVDSKLILNKLSPFIMKDIHHAIELKTSSTQSKRRDPLHKVNIVKQTINEPYCKPSLYKRLLSGCRIRFPNHFSTAFVGIAK